MWIWYRCQNRIGKHYHHNGEQLGCYKKVHAKTHRLSKKKDVIVILVLEKTKNSNLFEKNRTQDNVKCHIKHEERWLRWIVIELVNYKWHYFSFIFPERKYTLKISSEKVIVMPSEKMKAKYTKEDVWKSFFCKLLGWHLATSVRINFFTENFQRF